MKNKQAFTLLEIVVSLGILSIGILGIFSLIPTGVDQTSKSRDQAKAILLAQSKLQEIIGTAANNWESFILITPPLTTPDHYISTGNNNTPFYIGPNTSSERKKWGWIEIGNPPTGWVKKLGFQWEWHFIDTPVSTDDIALISLSVSWPQQWSNPDGTEQELLAHYDLKTHSSGDHFKEKQIQYVRLISYVSKGL